MYHLTLAVNRYVICLFWAAGLRCIDFLSCYNVSLQHALLQTWPDPLSPHGDMRAGPYDMGRIIHKPLFTSREAKTQGLRSLGHPNPEAFDGLRLAEAKGA